MSVPHVVHGPLVLEQLVARVSAPDRGATASFLGTVRAGPDDGPVVRIEYSAYEEMLDEEFGRITAEAAARWPGAAIAAQHRLGTVPLGDASIAIAVAAPHRAAALDACRYVIEEAKRRLPVWKREILADGATMWRDNDGGRVPGTDPARRDPPA
jgi:molybdopterin synthase catalytic subunit